MSVEDMSTTVSRRFGTKTFRHPLKKPVRHQESSVSRQIGTRTNQHRIFFQTNVISFFKIKSKKVKKNNPINDRLNAIKTVKDCIPFSFQCQKFPRFYYSKFHFENWGQEIWSVYACTPM